MAVGWFANILQAVGQGGLTAISRYDQLHKMDQENEIRRKQEARQMEQDKIAAEDRVRRQRLEDANAFFTTHAAGDVLSGTEESSARMNPIIAATLRQTPAVPGGPGGLRFNPAPSAASTITQMPQFNFTPTPAPPVNPTPITGVSFAGPNVAPASTPITENKDLFGTVEHTPGTPAIAPQTVFAGTAKDKEAEQLKNEAKATQDRMLSLAQQLQNPNMTPTERVARITELKILAGKQGSAFDVSDLYPRNPSTSSTQFNQFMANEAKKVGVEAVGDMTPQQWDTAYAKYKAPPASKPLSPEAIAGISSVYAAGGSLPGVVSYRSMGKDNLEKIGEATGTAIFNGANPTAAKSIRAADQTSLSNIRKIFDSTEAFGRTAQRNMQVFIDKLRNVPSNDMPIIDQFIRQGNFLWLGDPNVAGMLAGKSVAASEFVRVLASANGSGAVAQQFRDEINEHFHGGISADQAMEVFDTYMQDLSNRNDSYQTQIGILEGRIKAGAKWEEGKTTGGASGTSAPAVHHAQGDAEPEVRRVNGVPHVWSKVKNQWVEAEQVGGHWREKQ